MEFLPDGWPVDRTANSTTIAPAHRLIRIACLALALAYMLVSGPPIIGQDLRLDRIEHLTVERGLAHSTVWDVLQDQRGFLWFATVTALQRYDGYRFVDYTHDPNDPHSIASSEAMELFEDRDGALWIGFRHDGLDRYDRVNDRFVHFRPDAEDPASLIPGMNFAITQDATGDLWVGGPAGLNRVDPQTGRVRRYQHRAAEPHSLSSGAVNALYAASDDTLWVGTSSGLSQLDPETDRFTHFHEQAAAGSGPSAIFAITEDQNGTLWVGGPQGLHSFDRSRLAFTQHPAVGSSVGHEPISVIDLLQDRDGRLWAATEHAGIFHGPPSRASRATGSIDGWRQVLHHSGDVYGLSDNQTFNVIEDQTGILWIATRRGISKLDPRKERFEVFRFRPGDSRSLSGQRAWGITEDSRGTLWIATNDNGLTAIDRTNDVATHYLPDASQSNRLIHHEVTAVLEDRNGELWIGTENGLSRLDSTRQRFTSYRHDPDDPQSLASNHIYCLLEERLDSTSQNLRLWIGLFGNGLQRLERGSPERFVSYQHDSEDPGSLSSNDVYAIYQDRDRQLWIATGNGLNLLESEGPDTGRFRRYLHQPGNPNSLSHDQVAAIHQDPHGIFWIGTMGGGLNRFDPQQGHFQSWRQGQGLADDNVVGILEDARGRLWLSTSGGLSRFEPTTETIRNFAPSDGLHGNVFYIGSAYRSPRGELFFGGPGGVTAFFPERIEDDSLAPQVALTNFLLAGRTAPLAAKDATSPLQVSIGDTQELELNHRHSILAFEFAALHFGDPRRNRYAYRLAGFEDEWIETGAEHRFAQYTNLDAGTYTFEVKAANAEGIWSEEPVAVDLRVLPPPWKSWWAYVLYGLSVASALLVYVRSQQRKLDRERRSAEQERAIAERERAANQQLQEADRLKDEFLANTSHELRTPLYGMVGLAESLIDGARGTLPDAVKADLSMVAASGKRLSHLVNDILDFSKLRHKSLELRRAPIDLRALAEVVLTLSRPLVAAKDLKLLNQIPADLPAANADENRLQQILHNLVGNAIKFTETGSVTVSASVVEDRLRVQVADTGIGIPEAAQARIFDAFEQADASVERQHGGTGLGLAVTRQLVSLHGGEVDLESIPEEGSTFSFTLPISSEPAQVESETKTATAVTPTSLTVTTPSNDAQPPLQAAAMTSTAGGPRVLAVDDEPINLQVLQNYLAVEQFQLTLASSGEEALRLLEEETFDLVLLDVMMPKTSGYEVCRALRENHSLSDLPVIFLTAKSQDADVVTGMTLGANDYLTKPISKDRLMARVRPHLDLLNVHRDLESLVERKMSEVKVLKGLLPICAGCKKIRDSEGDWSELEVFIHAHSEAEFSHGLCPTCVDRYRHQTGEHQIQRRSDA